MKSTSDKLKNLVHPALLVTDEAYPLSMLRHAPEMSEIIWEIKRAFAKGIEPEQFKESSLKTYFLKGEDEKPIALFKFQDNPIKEYLAFRLDHHGFAGVPPTVVTTLEHPIWGGKRTGACQCFISDAKPVVKYESSHYGKFSTNSVHRMAILDLRLMNADRHTSNMLVLENRIIPIDHEFILSEHLLGGFFEWVKWEQADLPFTNEAKEYISLLNPERDRHILISEFGIKEEMANRLFAATIFLKFGAIYGQTPAQLGRFMMQAGDGRGAPTEFERLFTCLKFIKSNGELLSRGIYEEVERTFTQRVCYTNSEK